jgi:thiol-disulfide isomerase/thioredoxin
MMSRKTLAVILLSLVSMVTGISLFQIWAPDRTFSRVQSSTPEPSPPDTQMSLKDIPLVDLQGRSQKLVEWEQPVLVVNFWAPWCVPCRREVPDLIALQNEYGARIQVLGLALDSAENIISFADEHAMNYPSFLATSHISMYNAVFGNASGALPFTAIVDQDRKILYSHTGQISLAELREQVSKLLQPDLK